MLHAATDFDTTANSALFDLDSMHYFPSELSLPQTLLTQHHHYSRIAVIDFRLHHAHSRSL